MSYDVLVKNISIADGTGSPMFTGCVAVQDGKIVKVAPSIEGEAQLVIEGNEKQILCPGFFDTHTHGDMQRIFDPYMTTQILQGVTYDVCGNCGISAAPVDPNNFDLLKRYTAPLMPFNQFDEQWATWDTFGKYLDAVKNVGCKIHAHSFVGHGTLRIAAMGMEDRAPTAEEMEVMKSLLREAMEAGALGMSSGLIYAPGVYSTTEELVELCKVVAEFDGVYATHMRNESSHVVESVEEALTVARQAGCKLLVSHHKVSGPANRELYKKTLKLISDARAEGMNVICDQYQSNKGSTTIAALLPPFCQADGTNGLLRQLADPARRAEITNAMRNDDSYENFLKFLGAHSILIVSSEMTPQFNGKYLDEVAATLGMSAEDAVCQLELDNNGIVLMAVVMCEQDVVDEIFKFPYTCIGSDGIGAGTGTRTHPRAVGNMVHMLEDFVRNRKVVTWEEAIRKATSLPADFLNVPDKGRIAEGKDADLVIFDRENVGTDASFENPNVDPRGIDYVFVAGKLVVKDGSVIK